jgi:hypothetical protein
MSFLLKACLTMPAVLCGQDSALVPELLQGGLQEELPVVQLVGEKERFFLVCREQSPEQLREVGLGREEEQRR